MVDSMRAACAACAARRRAQRTSTLFHPRCEPARIAACAVVDALVGFLPILARPAARRHGPRARDTLTRELTSAHFPTDGKTKKHRSARARRGHRGAAWPRASREDKPPALFISQEDSRLEPAHCGRPRPRPDLSPHVWRRARLGRETGRARTGGLSDAADHARPRGMQPAVYESHP